MKTTIETITPEVAKTYLLANTKSQRAVRHAWVVSLAAMIKSGEFILTHQGIAFDSNGVLIDGQHRLLAIALADKPVEMMVTRGVDPEVWGATDQGVVRTSMEVTGLDKKIAEVARFIATLGFSERRPSAKMLIRIANSRLGVKAEEIRRFAPAQVRYYTTAPMLTIAAIRDCMSASDFAKHQFRALSTQDFDSMTSCSKALCRQVSTGKINGFKGPDMYCRAWKVFDPEKAGVSKIQVSEDDHRPTIAEIRFNMESLIEL